MGERWSTRVWLPWLLTGLLSCAGLALGLLVAAGRVEVRPASAAPDAGPQPEARALPAGPRIEPVAGAYELLEPLGQKAYCFRYIGARIDCWLEAEVDGKTTRLGDITAARLRVAAHAGADGPPAGGEPSGQLVCVRRRDIDREVWDLALSLSEDGKLVSGSSVMGISLPRPTSAGGGGEGPPEGGSLRGGREVTLTTVYTFGEKAGQITRKVFLKCRAAE